jgi:hypothetical protein
MKEKILKRLHQLQIEIIKANDKELDKIGLELIDIEKQLLLYNEEKGVNFAVDWQ